MPSRKKKSFLINQEPIILLAIRKSGPEVDDDESIFRDPDEKPYDFPSVPRKHGYTVLFIPMIPEQGFACC
ncbi:MAG: hypothetical protein ACHQRM_07190 [Bacteroidia bacterium]